MLNLSLSLPKTPTCAHTHTHTHTHTLTFWLHNVDFTDTDKQCEGSYHSTEHSNVEEEEEHDKEIGEDKKDGVCVVRVTGQRGPCIVPGLSVGRKRRPGPPLSKRPPCFMHSVLCDDKRQSGGWNAGLQGPREGWAYEE